MVPRPIPEDPPREEDVSEIPAVSAKVDLGLNHDTGANGEIIAIQNSTSVPILVIPSAYGKSMIVDGNIEMDIDGDGLTTAFLVIEDIKKFHWDKLVEWSNEQGITNNEKKERISILKKLKAVMKFLLESWIYINEDPRRRSEVFKNPKTQKALRFLNDFIKTPKIEHLLKLQLDEVVESTDEIRILPDKYMEPKRYDKATVAESSVGLALRLENIINNSPKLKTDKISYEPLMVFLKNGLGIANIFESLGEGENIGNKLSLSWLKYSSPDVWGALVKLRRRSPDTLLVILGKNNTDGENEAHVETRSNIDSSNIISLMLANSIGMLAHEYEEIRRSEKEALTEFYGRLPKELDVDTDMLAYNIELEKICSVYEEVIEEKDMTLFRAGISLLLRSRFWPDIQGKKMQQVLSFDWEGFFKIMEDSTTKVDESETLIAKAMLSQAKELLDYIKKPTLGEYLTAPAGKILNPFTRYKDSDQCVERYYNNLEKAAPIVGKLLDFICKKAPSLKKKGDELKADILMRVLNNTLPNITDDEYMRISIIRYIPIFIDEGIKFEDLILLNKSVLRCVFGNQIMKDLVVAINNGRRDELLEKFEVYKIYYKKEKRYFDWFIVQIMLRDCLYLDMAADDILLFKAAGAQTEQQVEGTRDSAFIAHHALIKKFKERNIPASCMQIFVGKKEMSDPQLIKDIDSILELGLSVEEYMKFYNAGFQHKNGQFDVELYKEVVAINPISVEELKLWNLCKNTCLIHGVNNSSVFRKFVGDEVKNLLFS